MQYVRVHEIEQLLSLYHDLQGMAQSTRIQIDNISGSGVTDDDIAALALHHATFDETPSYSTGAATDKTARVALKYESTLNLEAQEVLKELQSELLLIEVVVDKLNIALSIIPMIQKNIITLRYCDGLKWNAISDGINKDGYVMSKSAAKTRCREGIDRLSKIVRVTIDEYEQVMKLFA